MSSVYVQCPLMGKPKRGVWASHSGRFVDITFTLRGQFNLWMYNFWTFRRNIRDYRISLSDKSL